MTKDNLGSESWQSDQERIAALEKQVEVEHCGRMAAEIRADLLDVSIGQALDLVDRYGMTAGEHHQQWLIDQILRALLGDGYDAWVAAYNKPGYVTWDTGIAP